MENFKTFLIEALGDKVGEPVKPLKGHTDQKSAFLVDDYPYGVNQRTKIRYWLEYKKGKGYRFVSQTRDPNRERWHQPKASAYVDFAAFMYQDAKGFVGWKTIPPYSSLKDAEKFLKNYKKYLDKTSIDLLEFIIKRKKELGLP